MILSKLPWELDNSQTRDGTNTNYVDKSIKTQINLLNNNKLGYTQLVNGENYEDYKVVPNNFDTEENLRKQRARNQSAFEQAIRSIGQLAINEIALGTVLGFSNLYDVAAAAIDKDKKIGSYANPFTQFLEKAQDNVREHLEIYRENPGKALDFGDFGWWAENFVNVGSSAALLLPATGISKGLSALGKLSKVALTAGKIGYNESIGIRTINALAKKSARIARNNAKIGNTIKGIEEFNGYMLPAVFSRTMENFQESREVYKSAYDNVLNNLNLMSSEDIQDLKSRNPELANLNNEEIANNLAEVAAGKTFKEDYAMLLMDLIQFRGINKFWNAANKGAITPKVNRALNNAKLALNKEGREQIAAQAGKISLKTKVKDKIKNIIENPLTSVEALELSEGLEEGYQGIISDNSEEFVKTILDPSYSKKTLENYLTDETIWEQALWGVIGGIVFKNFAAGLGKGYNRAKANTQHKNGKITDEQFARSKMSVDELKIQNIESWNKNTEELYANFALLNNGKNPFKKKKDNKGIPITDENGYQYEDITTEEAEDIKKQLIDKYLLDLYQGASLNGNGDILEAFVNSEEFKKAAAENGIKLDANENNIDEYINNRYDFVTDAYEKSLYDIYGTVSVGNEYAARAQAYSYALNKLRDSYLNQQIAIYENILKENTKLNNENYSIQDRLNLANKIADRLNELDEEERQLKEEYGKENNEIISKAAYNFKLKEINKERIDLNREYFLNSGVETTDDIKNILKDYKQLFNEEDINTVLAAFNESYASISEENSKPLKETITDAIDKKNTNIVEKISNNAKTPLTAEDYNDDYKAFARDMDKYISQQYKKAINDFEKYINEQTTSEEIDNAYRKWLKQDESLNSDLIKASKLLKIGGWIYGTNEYTNTVGIQDLMSISEIINKAKEKLNDDEQKATTAVVNNTKTVKTKKQTTTQATKASDTAVSSTGEQVLTEDEVKAIEANITKEDGINPINLIDSSAEQLAIQEALAIQGKQQQLSEVVYNILVDTYKSNKDLIVNVLKNPDVNGEEYKKIYDMLLNRLTAYEADENKINAAIKVGIRSYLREQIISKLKGTSATSFIDNANKLINNIVFKSDTTELDLSNEKYKKLIDDFIESYIKIFKIGFNKDSNTDKYIINIEDLFEKLLEDQSEYINNENTNVNEDKQHINLNFNECLIIFNNLENYIANNDKYLFINTNKYIEYKNNPITFINKLIEAKKERERIITDMRINGKKYDNKEIIDKIIEYFKKNKKIYARLVNSGIEYYITVNSQDIQVGFTTRIEKDEHNNTIGNSRFEYNGSLNNSGFIFEINVNDEECTLTPFFMQIMKGYQIFGMYKEGDRQYEVNKDAVELYKLLQDRYINGQLEPKDGDIAKKLLENKYIVELINKKLFGFGSDKNITDVQKANRLINAINNILFYNNTLGRSAADIYESYNNYIKRVLENYKRNYDLQQQLIENKEVEIQFAGYQNSSIAYGDENYSLSEYKETGLNNKDNKIAIIRDGNIYIENDDNSEGYNNTVDGYEHQMGIVLKRYEGQPIVAWFSQARHLVSNDKIDKDNKQRQELVDAVRTELTNILNRYNEGENIETVTNDLMQLLRNPLFYGINVARKNTGEIFLKFIEDENKDMNFFILRKDSKGNPEKALYYKNDKNKTIRVNNIKAETINKIVDSIMNNITFSATRYMFYQQNVATDVSNDNKYVRKKDNKLNITIGEKEFNFDSFTDFVYKMNAFDLNIDLSEANNGVETVNTANNNSPAIFVNIDNISLPVEGREINDDYIFENSSSPSYQSVEALLRYALQGNENVDEIINILFGANAINTPIVPQSFVYEPGVDSSDAHSNNKTIFITEKGRNAIRAKKSIALRLIIHEQLHNMFRKTDIRENSKVVDDILDTLRATLESLQKDNSKEAKTIYNWIIENGLDNYENYYKKHTDNKESKEKQRTRLAEEWLTECLTRPDLISYLNRTDYIKDGKVVQSEDNTNKTLLQKIADIIIEIFDKIFGTQNLHISKKSSIFAYQYSLLGTISDNKGKVRTKKSKTIIDTSNIVESNKTPKRRTKSKPIDNQLELNFENEPIADENNLDKLVEDLYGNGDLETNAGIEEDIDLDLFSATSEIEINNDLNTRNGAINTNIVNGVNVNDTTVVANSESFVSTFPTAIQPLIAENIKNGDIKILC